MEDNRKVILAIQLEEKLKEKLKAEADSNGLSMSAEIRLILLERYKEEE